MPVRSTSDMGCKPVTRAFVINGGRSPTLYVFPLVTARLVDGRDVCGLLSEFVL